MPAADATALAEALGAMEKLVAAAMVRYTRRAGAGAAGLLAGVSGSAAGAAKRRIQAAEQMDSLPAVRRAFFDGQVSVEQAAVIAPTALVAPDEAGALLDAAKRGSSLRELRTLAARTLRHSHSEESEIARERRLHARRYCRAWPGEDGVRVEALLTATEGARFVAALDKECDALFHETWKAGITEPRERLRADALVRLATGAATPAGTQVVVRVDAAALVRGELEGGEICEIDGVGPVSVTTARSLLGEGFLTLLVRDGADVKTVTSTTRTIPRRVRTALADRDPTCVVPGCSATSHLEIDHWRLDFAEHGLTELDNLCRLCPTHHRLKTKEGWRIGGGPGKWRWMPPRAGP